MTRRPTRTNQRAEPKIDIDKIKEAINDIKKAYSMCRDRSINNVLARAIEKLEEAIPPIQE